MASVEKISVSIAQSELDWAREQAEAEGTSLSAVLTDALRRQRQALARRQLLELLGVEELSEAELEAAREELRRLGVGAK